MGNSGQKATQKQLKMTVSAGTKTFENLKLENYRSDIYETCPVGVPPKQLFLLKTVGVNRRGGGQRVYPKTHQKLPGVYQNLNRTSPKSSL